MELCWAIRTKRMQYVMLWRKGDCQRATPDIVLSLNMGADSCVINMKKYLLTLSENRTCNLINGLK